MIPKINAKPARERKGRPDAQAKRNELGEALRATGRLRLPHPRPGLPRLAADRAHHDPGRGGAADARDLARQATVRYEFPGTEFTAGPSLPLTWYDGEGHVPPREALGLPEGQRLPVAGSLLLGEKGSLLVPHVAAPRLFPEEVFADHEIESVPARDHYVSWADACRGEGRTTSSFDYAGPLSETVLLGSIAIRTPGETLRWDQEELKITNVPAADALLRKPYREGWEPSWDS